MKTATVLSSLSSHSTTTTTTTVDIISPPEIPSSKRLLYEEFKALSLEIRKHDNLYYNNNNNNINNNFDDPYDDDSSTLSSTTSSKSSNDQEVRMIDDDEFDALVRREEFISIEHPDLLIAWQIESGWGVQATRSGRVGMNVVGVGVSDDNDGTDGIEPTTSHTTKDKETGRKELLSTTTTTDNSETLSSTTTSSIRIKRQHLTPMLSLDNVHNNDQLLAWLKRVIRASTTKVVDPNSSSMEEKEDHTINNNITDPQIFRIPIITEPKLDGVSLSLRYELNNTIGTQANNDTTDNDDDQNNKVLELVWASTRGDGKTGQDVTSAVLQMNDQDPMHTTTRTTIPNKLHLPHHLLDCEVIEIRGEVVLPRTEFLRLKDIAQNNDTTNDNTSEKSVESLEETITKKKRNTNRLESFANARNAASGLLMRKESDNVDEEELSKGLRSLLRFYAYDISFGTTSSTDPLASSTTNIMNGDMIREQLQEWGYKVALPSITTTLEIDRNLTIDDSMDDILNEQITPMLEYYNQLQEYRQMMEQSEDDNLGSSRQEVTKRRKETSKLQKFTWGDFDMDGCVHKISDAQIRRDMGSSMKSPKWAVAHKFPAQAAVSRLLDITVQVGRTGALTPVAVLEPTDVGGVTIQRATMHNFEHMRTVLLGLGEENDEDNDDESATNTTIGRVPKGQTVLVRRAGDVIPQVVRRVGNQLESYIDPDDNSTVVDDTSNWISLKQPNECPACGSKVVIEEIKATSKTSVPGQLLRCGGPPMLCPPRAVASLTHAFARDALDVSGLSEARIEQLMNAGLVRYPKDIFAFGETEWDTAANLPRWGEKSCRNLRETTNRVASTGVTLGRFIYSLGIRHVGKHSSELIASSYGTVDEFLEGLSKSSAISTESNGTEESNDNTQPILFPPLQAQLGVGPVMIRSLHEFSQNEELMAAAQDLAGLVRILEQEVVVVGSESEDPTNIGNDGKPWRGLSVVFTGKLDTISRSEAQTIAKRLGAKSTPSSLSKSTDILVYGEKSGPKKMNKAKDLGVTLMTYEEFIALVEESGLAMPSS